jgi:adenosine deaminase
MYAAATKVLITEDDFYRLAQQYFARAEAENIRAAEIFFDPQGHLARWACLGLLGAIRS